MSSRPLLWSLVQQIGRQFSGYLIFVVLAALLPPKDFGVLGIATAWLGFMSVFAELGFGVALIQRADVTSAHYSSTFYLNLALGALLCLLGVLLAGPAASLLGIPEARPVIMVLSAGFLIHPFSLTQVAVAQKAMRFKDLAKRDIFGGLGAGLVGIALAIAGCGIWSLVAQGLCSTLFGAILLWRFSDFRPRLAEVSFARIRDLWGYSSTMFAYNFFKFAVQNSDRLLVGYFLGAEPLGYYTFANKIILSPTASVRAAIGAYLFPLFSRLQADLGAVKGAYLDINKGVGRLMVPGLLAAGALVPVLVPLAFGGKWDPAVPLVQILSLVGAMQFLIAPVGELMKALGRPKWLLVWSVVFAALSTGLLAIGCQGGITTTGWAFALAHVIAVPINMAMARRLIPLDAADIARILWPLLLFAIPVAGLAYAGGALAPGDIPSSAWIAVPMLAGAAALAWTQRGFLANLKQGGGPGSSPPPPPPDPLHGGT